MLCFEYHVYSVDTGRGIDSLLLVKPTVDALNTSNCWAGILRHPVGLLGFDTWIGGYSVGPLGSATRLG